MQQQPPNARGNGIVNWYRSLWRNTGLLGKGLLVLIPVVGLWVVCGFCIGMVNLVVNPGSRQGVEVASNATPRATRTPRNEPTSVPSPTAAPTQTLTPDQALAALASDEFGERVKKVSLVEVEGKMTALIEYDLGPQLDEGSAVLTAQLALTKIAPRVFEIPTVEFLDLLGYGDFKDALGNSSSDVAFRFGMTRALAEKINWAGFDIHRMEDAFATDPASNIFVHQALRQAWAKSQE